MSTSEVSPAPDPRSEVRPSRPLRVAALVKQVPVAESLTLGPDGRLQREGTEREMNPYCRRAVSKGVELARISGGKCTVFTLGPPAAEDVLREAVAWGADDGVHVRDPAFAGSDTLATSRALRAALVREGPFDLVLVGRNTIDGDTGQVGPQLAQLLELPFSTGVHDLALDGETLTLHLEHDDGWVDAVVDLPVVLSVAERLTEPAKVPPEGRAAVPPERIRRVSAADLGPGPWGEAGSPTRVGAVRAHVHDRARTVLSGDPAEQVDAAVAMLRERGALSAGPAGGSGHDLTPGARTTGSLPGGAHTSETHPPGARTTGGKGGTGDAAPDPLPAGPIAVLLEPGRDQVAGELLGTAAHLAARLGSRVVAFRPAGAGPDDLGALGADDSVDLDGEPVPEDVAVEVATWAIRSDPWLVLAASTAFGREVAGRVSAALGAGLVGDAIGLEVAAGRIVAAKPAFAGALVADITCTSPIQMVTVRPGVLRPERPEPRRATRSTRALSRTSRVHVVSSVRDDDVGVLARAPFVVGVGMGVPPDEYAELKALCDVLGAELAATRKVTDKGWMPRSRQVGLTGHSIAPRLYVAIGLSGKFNHTVGVRSAETVLAVNNDPGALVFEHADVGIVADWHDVVPLLTSVLGLTPVRDA